MSKIKIISNRQNIKILVYLIKKFTCLKYIIHAKMIEKSMNKEKHFFRRIRRNTYAIQIKIT